MPHWIGRRIASKDKLPEMRESQVLQELGLIQSLSGGQVRVAPPMRQYLVDRLARDQRPRYGELSRRCYDLFSAVEKPPVELYIEAQYHRLAVDERGAAAQLFRDAVQVHSEPVFAFETLRRLLLAWREQETRGVLSDVGTSYLRVAELFDPAARRPPEEEIAVLLPIAKSRKIADPAFQAEVNLRLGLAEMALGDISQALRTAASTASTTAAGIELGKSPVACPICRSRMKAATAASVSSST
jgi:hypothetical protein